MKLVITTAYVHMVTCYCQMEVSISAFIYQKFLGTYGQTMWNIHNSWSIFAVQYLTKYLLLAEPLNLVLYRHLVSKKVLVDDYLKSQTVIIIFDTLTTRKVCGNEIHFGRISAFYSLVAYELYNISMSL
jgi:hypothetical protein